MKYTNTLKTIGIAISAVGLAGMISGTALAGESKGEYVVNHPHKLGYDCDAGSPRYSIDATPGILYGGGGPDFQGGMNWVCS